MLNKKYNKGSAWKGLILFPVAIVLMMFIACENNASMNDKQDGINNQGSPESEALTANADNKNGKPLEEEIFYVVEEMPQWPGGEDLLLSMRKFIAQNLTYPDIAKETNAEGKVFIRFIVTHTGEVIVPDPSMLPPEKSNEGNDAGEVFVVAYRSLSPEAERPADEVIKAFEKESVRVIELMPKLVPGKQRGKEVNVMFTMPIVFKLQ